MKTSIETVKKEDQKEWDVLSEMYREYIKEIQVYTGGYLIV